MDREQSWPIIIAHRRAVADLLDTLTDRESKAPSLCSGWRVRDVAAHLAMIPNPPSAGAMLVESVRARGLFGPRWLAAATPEFARTPCMI